LRCCSVSPGIAIFGLLVAAKGPSYQACARRKLRRAGWERRDGCDGSHGLKLAFGSFLLPLSPLLFDKSLKFEVLREKTASAEQN
jgi:hypothetical protein